MPATYEKIATSTLGSAAAGITFSSIPSTYTDLKIVFVSTHTGGGDDINLRINSDSSSLYSYTAIMGNGTAASSNRETALPFIRLSGSTGGGSPTYPSLIEIDLFSYAGSTNKTILSSWSSDRNGSGFKINMAGLYRSTTAISTLYLFSNTNYAAGTTATLYGILKA